MNGGAWQGYLSGSRCDEIEGDVRTAATIRRGALNLVREDFTDYLRSLDPQGKPPDSESFDRVWAALLGALIGELKRRGLWTLPPSYAGVHGWEKWQTTAANGASGTTSSRQSALDELVAECYTFIFIDRVDSLRAQLRRKANIDGLAFLNIRNFLHERQRQCDPLGFRVFTILQSAVRHAVADGELYVLSGDPRIRNDTVLAFRPDADPAAARRADSREVDLEALVERWTDDLLPELVTTRGRGHRTILAKLRRHLQELETHGVEVFLFKRLVDPLKSDVRSRWASILEVAGGETALEDSQDGLATVVPLVRPEPRIEARESFEKLVDCVDERVEGIEASGRMSRDVATLWNLLLAYAAEPGDLLSPRGRAVPPTIDAGAAPDKMPSGRKIAQLWGISRDRLPSLYGTLRQQVEDCLAAIHGDAVAMSPGAAAAAQPAGRAKMSVQDLRQELRRKTGEAMARSVRAEEGLRRQPAEAPWPGDVYLFDENVGTPVEWVVLGEDPAVSGHFLMAAADTNPIVGSGDLTTRAEDPAGPLTLRLRHTVSLPAESFAPAKRRAVLASEILALARKRRQEDLAGRLRGSVRQREIDLEPAYEDWIREVVEPARAALLARDQEGPSKSPTTVTPFRGRNDREPLVPPRRSVPAYQVYALVAAFVLVAIGLSTWIGIARSHIRRITEDFSRELATQHEKIAQLSMPSLDVLDREIVLNDRQRTIEPIPLPRETSHLLLYLVVQEREPCESYGLELRTANDRLLESGFEQRGSEFRLILPRDLLSGEPLKIRLYGVCSGEDKLLEQRELLIDRQ